MVRTCLLCDNKAGKRSEDHFHRFPKKQELRSKWIQACCLNAATDDVSTLWICSKHFRSTDYRRTGYPEVKKFLIQDAVPTLLLPRQSKHLIVEQVKVPALETYDNSQRFIETCVSPQEIIESKSSLEKDTALNNSPEATISIMCKKKFENVKHESLRVVDDDNNSLQTRYMIIKTEEEIPSTNSSTIEFIDEFYECDQEDWERQSDTCEDSDFCQIPKKRRFAEPRYFSEITESDMATPRRARITLRLMTETLNKKEKKIKQLQNANRYLKERVMSWEKMFARLREKGYISNEVGDSVMIAQPTEK